MKTEIIGIDNQGNGFQEAIDEVKKLAACQNLNAEEALQLEHITEETLSLIRSVTGELQASFWSEVEDKAFCLHVTTKTAMDKEKRGHLISSASSRKNEITNTFLGRLRDAIEQAIAADVVRQYDNPEADFSEYLNYHPADPEWDGYEKSILKQLADNIKISIRGGLVEMTVSKDYAK